MSHHHHAKHRRLPASRDGRRGRRTTLLTSVAVGAAGLATTAGVLSGAAPAEDATSASPRPAATAGGLSAEELAARQRDVSRSEVQRRPVGERAETRQARSGSGSGSGRDTTAPRERAEADPKAIARTLMPRYGISVEEFGCLDSLWSGESDWSTTADNPTSSAYGIPQALPGSKMASAGADWETNPRTQVRWGLGYIKDRYGTACSAEAFKQGNGWY